MSSNRVGDSDRRAAVLQQHVSASPSPALPSRFASPHPIRPGGPLISHPAGVGGSGRYVAGNVTPSRPARPGAANPPALPPRANTSTPWNNTLSSPYGGYGLSGGFASPASLYNSTYSRLGMYNNPIINRYAGGIYGAGGMGMSPYMGNASGTDLTQAAVENSRPAFDAILSVIHAFGSVSMMLESMFDAVYSSFRAVLGAADQFQQMKATFTDIYTSFALFRLLRYFYRKLLVLLRLKKTEDIRDSVAWSEATSSAARDTGDGLTTTRKSHWPVVIFMSIAVGGPYLVYKFLSHFISSTEEIERDLRQNRDSIVLKALYDFSAQRNDELSFRAGDILLISPYQLQGRVQGGVNPWGKAMLHQTGAMGLIPMNYVTAVGRNNRGAASEMNSLNTQWDKQQRNVVPPSAPLLQGNKLFDGSELPPETLEHGTQNDKEI